MAKVVLHSDGAVEPLIPYLVECGVDCLNPIQVSAKGMDSAGLKAKHGNHMSFWGGIDTQGVLPFGTPDEVRAEVKRRIEDLAQGGGLVLGTVHNIQPEVPPQNIVAMFEAAREYGRY
jgi:uroporphyrinogen decarboxylase